MAQSEGQDPQALALAEAKARLAKSQRKSRKGR